MYLLPGSTSWLPSEAYAWEVFGGLNSHQSHLEVFTKLQILAAHFKEKIIEKQFTLQYNFSMTSVWKKILTLYTSDRPPCDFKFKNHNKNHEEIKSFQWTSKRTRRTCMKKKLKLSLTAILKVPVCCSSGRYFTFCNWI